MNLVNSRELGPLLDSTHHETAEHLAEFVRDKLQALLPEAEQDSEARHQAREMVRLLGEAGWLGCLVPEQAAEWAAGPRDTRTLCLIREALAWASPLADAVFALQGLGSRPLALEAADTPWLGKVARGEAVAAFAMTEPEAGSDVAALTTSARKEGDHYLLNGRKTLISNAGMADFYVVFASHDAARGSRGIGAFLVEAEDPGLNYLGPQLMSAPHPLGELAFHNSRARLIHLEGFKLGMRTLDALRPSVAAAACGMAARALHEATQHALHRIQFGKPLADFQITQQKLAQMSIGLDAARLLTYRAAWRRDQGEQRNTREVAMAKAFATETAQQVVDASMQICGGAAMLANHPVEHLYRAVRSLRIYEGTTEIQHLIIAKDLLKAAQDPDVDPA